ncbi:MAG: hypothetical protein MK207_12095 [Saprospiraceae bacterium]|nr:hypothetical protein [Saprospiraceae bacterium]
MKTKIAFWGTKETENTPEKVLVALQLNPSANKLTSYIFEGELATNEFSKILFEQWQKGVDIEFPPNTKTEEVALSASGTLLPEGITTSNKELLSRTQTEWIFIVLSTKLYQNYQAELDELQEKTDALVTYSKEMWENMKTFWAKVQAQINEHNLFREHQNTLKDHTNELFSQLKKLRSAQDSQFEEEANLNYKNILEKLEVLEDLTEKTGSDFHQIFEKLKSLQLQFKNAKLTRNLRSKLWERIDLAFKKVKSKRSTRGSAEGRLLRRIEGLKGAIDRMENSIFRDNKDLSSQNHKINSGDVSQLENQLREVRGKLIQERIDSKNKKLKDMYNTLKDLEKKHTKNLEKIENTKNNKIPETENKDSKTNTSDTPDNIIETEKTEEKIENLTTKEKTENKDSKTNTSDTPDNVIETEKTEEKIENLTEQHLEEEEE